MKELRHSAMKHIMSAALPACACALMLSCAFGDEDALQSLFQETTDPLVVAAGDSSIYLSPTGMIWSGNLFPGGDSLRDVAYGMGKFIAAGWGMIAPGVAYLSEDGVVWVGPVNFPNSMNAVACYKGLYIAAGEDFIRVSRDGFIWAPVCKNGGNFLYDLAVGNGLIIAVGGDAATGKVYVSSDGLGWAGPITINGVMVMSRVAYGNGTFVAVTTHGEIAASKDGFGWAVYSGPATSPDYLTAIAYGSGKFVAASNTGTIYASAEGVFWTRLSGAPSAIKDIEYCYGNFIGVGDNGLTIVSSNGLDCREKILPVGLSLWGIGCRQ